MLAVWVKQPGGVEQLEVRELPVPALGHNEVLIAVRAAALNRADLLQRRGLYPPPPGGSPILGLECAGVVEQVGSAVQELTVGARVMALLPGGGYASRVAVDARLVLPIPADFSFVEATAIPEAFLTAQEALFTLGELEPGGWVLIHAAAGGVGSAALQLCRQHGARAIAVTSSAEKGSFARSLGAEVCINHREEDFVARVLDITGKQGVSVILDFIGGSYTERHTQCLVEQGRWVVLGLLGGTSGKVDFARVLARRLKILGLVMRTRPLADRAAIVERFRKRWLPEFANGGLRPVVDRCYPLAAVAEAHAYMEQNATQGKIVLEMPLET
jgi:tumor protein p53-inducible protein 3